jgi:hypothetical protein
LIDQFDDHRKVIAKWGFAQIRYLAQHRPAISNAQRCGGRYTQLEQKALLHSPQQVRVLG